MYVCKICGWFLHMFVLNLFLKFDQSCLMAYPVLTKLICTTLIRPLRSSVITCFVTIFVYCPYFWQPEKKSSECFQCACSLLKVLSHRKVCRHRYMSLIHVCILKLVYTCVIVCVCMYMCVYIRRIFSIWCLLCPYLLYKKTCTQDVIE